MKKTVVELFAGVGGFRVGLNKVKLENGKVIENGPWDFVWANQWEPSTKIQPAFECYVKRFGESDNHVNEDIAKIDKNTIPDHTLLVGGFPCQDYSVARTLSGGKGIEGKKGVLWWQIYDVLDMKQPPFVLLENVDRLLKSPSDQRGRDFGIMLRGLYDLGYSVEWRVINAGDYGLPQRRRRVFIFAFHKSTNYYKTVSKQSFETNIYEKSIFAETFKIDKDIKSKHNPTSGDISKYKDIVTVSNNFKNLFRNSGIMLDGKFYSIETQAIHHENFKLKSLLETRVANRFYLNNKQIKKFKYLKGPKRIPRVKPNGESYVYSEGGMAFPEHNDMPGRTMLTSESSINRSTHVVRISKRGKLRFITPVEAERLNTFPDDWTDTGMTERQRYFMMGNALVCKVIEALGTKIESIIDLQ